MRRVQKLEHSIIPYYQEDLASKSEIHNWIVSRKAHVEEFDNINIYLCYNIKKN